MKKKILSSILSLVFVFSILASAVMIFPQNAKSEGEPGNSTNWSCYDFEPTQRQCNDGHFVIFCDWDLDHSTICCPNVQDLCDED